jgi:integrase
MRKTLTDRGVAALKPRPHRYAYPDPELRGHYVRVQPGGAKTFVAVARNPQGKQVWATVGATDVLNIDEARGQAREAIGRIRAGKPPVEAKADTFADVAASWLKRHIVAKNRRSHYEINRLLDRHVLPMWGEREFTAIRRSDVAALLDVVEDNHSPRQADAVLTVVRSIMNWFAARNDDYGPPIVRGMRRQSPTQQARTRILDDQEIRTIWRAAEANGPFGGFVRLLLLTAQRRAKVASMRWGDVSLDGEWTIPSEDREKGNAGSIMLPDVALAIIRNQPHIGDNPHIFAGRGNNPINGFSKGKRRFDAKLPADMPGWTLHDLRRTARSLLSRAGVSSEHAERVMGHAITGVEGVYDRHSYREEKADALKRLAALIDSIVHPRDNVLPMSPKKRKQR